MKLKKFKEVLKIPLYIAINFQTCLMDSIYAITELGAAFISESALRRVEEARRDFIMDASALIGAIYKL